MTRHPCAAQVLTAVVLIAALAPAAGLAQTNTPIPNSNLKDGRWQSWLGCWTPIERAPRDRDIQVCITPTAAATGVRLTTFAGDQRILDESIVADGSTQTTTEDNCRASSRSRWSRSAPRLFRTTELNCDSKAPQRTAEIASLENPDQWLDVQVVSIGGSENVRTRRYVRSALTPPADIRDQLAGLSSRAAAVDAAVSVDDVIEANAMATPRAVEAWLSESEVNVSVRKATLLALAKAKVPANVIDLMIARAYPSHFEVHRSSGGGAVGSFFDDVAWASPFDLMFDPYAFYYSPFGSYHRFVDPSYYYGLGGYVIVPTPGGGGGASGSDSSAARVVNGSGYTRVEPRQPAAIVGPRPPGATADSYDSGSSSSGGSASTSSGDGSVSSAGYSAGGGGQTAVPR